jgi:hypothetical protein
LASRRGSLLGRFEFQKRTLEVPPLDHQKWASPAVFLENLAP